MLKAGFPCVRYCNSWLLGVKHITEDLGDTWYDMWAQDACDFADAMGIDKFFYSGVSHGAGIGWHICVNHQERVRAFFSIVGGPHSKDGQETGSAVENHNEQQRQKKHGKHIATPGSTLIFQENVRKG